jgi:spore coat polysaccharide biosynthesis predicted glycosyltransferase SpsG
MNQRWLFRVDVGGERETAAAERARGLGHAIKCLSLSHAVRARGGAVHFSVEGADDVKPIFEERGVTCDLTTDHEDVIESFDPNVIVTDVNYLDIPVVNQYRESAMVVNLAPRGMCKYYAHLSFTSERIVDVPKPANASIMHWYTGPQYTILNQDFVNLRTQLDTTGWNLKRRGVVVQMGGVDQFDMTGAVLDAIDQDRLGERNLTVIAGPFNPHISELQQRCSEISGAELIVNPDNLAEIVASHELGVFGTGISTFEALSVGVPSLNVGLSEFHDRRGELLGSKGLTHYLGRFDQISPTRFNDILFSNLNGNGRIVEMRERGVETIDGRGPYRVVETTIKHLE